MNGISTPFTYTGGNIGFDFNLGYHRVVSKHFSIGINTGIFFGNIRNITVDNGLTKKQYNLETEDSINLSNFNTGLHLNYSF